VAFIAMALGIAMMKRSKDGRIVDPTNVLGGTAAMERRVT
jgi:hypothetical protein